MPCHEQIVAQLDSQVQVGLTALREEPTLAGMVRIALGWARAAAVLLVETVLAERAEQAMPWRHCPSCGGPLQSKGRFDRTVQTLIGVVSWRRPVGRCPRGCRLDGVEAPLDQALGLQPGQRSSDELRSAACALCIFVPFATAAALLQQVSGLNVSAGAMWTWVQAAGTRAMKRLEERIAALEAGEMPEADIDPDVAAFPLIQGGDGVMAPFRPRRGSPRGKTAWREVKVGVVARLGERVTRDRKVVTQLLARRLVAVLGDVDALGWRLAWTSIRQGLHSAPSAVWISDGARGLWGLYEKHFAEHARGVLDFYHAAQHLWDGARARHRGSTHKAWAWFSDLRHRLRHGKADTVADDIDQALKLTGLPASARETLLKLKGYLTRHSDHLDYEQVKRMGLPIGSGMVESACKWLVQQRFKGVGMRWSEEGFNHLLHLRLAWVNGEFNGLFASPNS